jgi:hypothetical protein
LQWEIIIMDASGLHFLMHIWPADQGNDICPAKKLTADFQGCPGAPENHSTKEAVSHYILSLASFGAYLIHQKHLMDTSIGSVYNSSSTWLFVCTVVLRETYLVPLRDDRGRYITFLSRLRNGSVKEASGVLPWPPGHAIVPNGFSSSAICSQVPARQR